MIKIGINGFGRIGRFVFPLEDRLGKLAFSSFGPLALRW